MAGRLREHLAFLISVILKALSLTSIACNNVGKGQGFSRVPDSTGILSFDASPPGMLSGADGLPLGG